MSVPKQPKIYHITHVDNLPQLVESGWLWSDAERIRQELECHVVGMSTIKKRRLEENEVSCHPGTMVGDYAPFYFCPRSIMLFILHRGNHPDVTYRGTQLPIVHLQADLRATVDWADTNGVRWAFTDANAGSRYFESYNDLSQLDEINWKAVAATDFRDPLVKDGKQAEFLIHSAFPWELVEKVGVINPAFAGKVQGILQNTNHQPPVSVERSWYF